MKPAKEKFEMVEELNEKTITIHKKKLNHDNIFRVGEEVELKGSCFRVKSVKPTELRLKLLRKKQC